MPAAERKTVVIGLVGNVLDAGTHDARWHRWRPSVAVGQHEDLRVDRYELLANPRHSVLRDVVCGDLATVSPETDVRCHDVAMDDPWDFAGVYGALLDWCEARTFDPDAEDYLVHITTGSHVAQISWFLLVESRQIPGRLLQTAPPRKHAKESGGPGEWRTIDLDLSRYDRLAARSERRHAEGSAFLKQGIATRNDAFNRLIDRIERVAIRSRAPILLTGPTGAGKSRLAGRIHELKVQRREMAGRFVEVNCATLRGDAAMSTLFGHTKGAFTGAVTARPGLLKSADGGMLFLDEIGELGLDEQAMLLRAIEEGTFLPVGSDREQTSAFELIAGTNRDLAASVRAGTFREDLLARINLWTFDLPALRDRPEDLEPNLDFELDRVADSVGGRVRFNKEARRAFLAFAAEPASSWAGNFRDLNAAVVRMATLSPGGRITAEVVAEEADRLRRGWAGATPGEPADDLLASLLGDRLEDVDRFDRAQLAEVLRMCRQSKSLSEAGRTLFQASRARRRTTNDADRLRKYLARFGLTFENVQKSPR